MFSGAQLTKKRQELGWTQSEVARQLGITRASLFNWESNKTQPNQKNLQKLASLFEVPVEYFKSESEIVQLYLQLNEENQKNVLNFAKETYDKQRSAKVRLYEYKVYEKLSAGTGHAVADDAQSEYVYFDKKMDYDIASWVYGDSMEPKYLNGSVALIKETGFDYDGAIYAVVWEGETYLKKVYREANGFRLVSLNKAYADKFAPYEDEPRIVGKLVGNFVPMER